MTYKNLTLLCVKKGEFRISFSREFTLYCWSNKENVRLLLFTHLTMFSPNKYYDAKRDLLTMVTNIGTIFDPGFNLSEFKNFHVRFHAL